VGFGLLLVLVACSGGGAARDDVALLDAPSEAPLRDGGPAEAGPEVGAYPAPHSPAPREIFGGGTVLSKPRIVPITYDNDPLRAKIELFVTKLGASSFWKEVTSEYGVGPAVSGRPVHLSEAAPKTIDDVEVKAWFASRLDGSHPEFDPPDDQTMYALYFPSGTTYTLGGWTGCKEFGASDNMTTLPDGRRIPYIALPRCPPTPGLDAWNTLSAYSSHEFYEEATDPFKEAWVTVDDDHMAWSLTPPFSEIGDMCVADPTSYLVPADIGSAVQRAWSNRAARAGTNPCVPAPKGVYFNAAPVLDDAVVIGFGSAGAADWSSTTKGVRIPVGGSKKVEIDLFSDAPVAPWRVRAFDVAAATGADPELALYLDRDHGQNGDKLELTIEVLRAGAFGGSRFLLVSDDGVRATFWFGYVGN
jgi:hypothetical protein